jgi:hypothetical protein
MKKLVLVLALAAAALLGFRWLNGWRAVTAYERFAEAWMRGNKAEAMKLGEAEAVDSAFDKHALRGMPSGAIIDAFHGTRYTIESKTRSRGGDLQLEARQTILFDPPGAFTGIGGAMLTHIHHSATLRKTADGWKVVTFEPRYLDMGVIRRH